MQSFQSFQRVVVGGVDRFQFVPIDWVQDFPAVNALSISELDINLIPGKEWLDGFSPFGTLEYTDQPKTIGASQYRSKELTGIIPGDIIGTAENLYRNRYRKFLIKTVDKDGRRRLLGSLKEPMRLSFDFKTGQLGGVKGWTYSFYGNHRMPSPHLLTPAVSFYIDAEGNLIQVGSNSDTFALSEESFSINGPNETDYALNSSGFLQSTGI